MKRQCFVLLCVFYFAASLPTPLLHEDSLDGNIDTPSTTESVEMSTVEMEGPVTEPEVDVTTPEDDNDAITASTYNEEPTTTESNLKYILSRDLVPPKTQFKKYEPDPRYDY